MIDLARKKRTKKKPNNTYSRTYVLPSAPHLFTSKFEMELGGSSGLLLLGNWYCETEKEFTLRFTQADRAISTSKLNPSQGLHI